ncbi:glycosyl hydrolase family 95 catalytic domain-containing protein [Jeotgalibaca caeni]|uniref:glycosyl hydrolase family 95 catalytic domain-containing protein n=1 Tax=Jeotgalibaca caeni TaxID=3028623 RepID=UPI00237DA3FC|nr:hypothetical protein [Jeotgalibaca caeni]MDE1549101.1 hypothetical protein [Jeotgalibaca caeni]
MAKFIIKSAKQTLTINKNMWQQVNQYVDHSSYYTNGQIETDGKIEGIENGFAIQQATYIICRVALNEALSPPIDWEEDFRESSQMWQERYEGTSLLLVSEEERLRSIDSIIAEMEASDTIPLVLYEKLYAASRYVLQSCSGTSIPNLQGIWTGTFEPAWSGDYTFDTNVELAIASFSRLGLFQELRAVFDRLKHYFADFQENAQRIYGCRGFFVPSHASTTAKHVQWNQEWPLITWTAGAAWLGHFYAEYADYTGDLNFLREDALPFWKQTILFYEDFLLKQEDALLFRPSYSPENGMGDNAAFDVAALKETLTNTIAAHLLLGEPVPGNYREMFEKLPMYAINEEGILKEWIDPKKEEHYNHRHFSQFYPLFESKEIQPDKNPELWQATEKAFDKKMEAWVTNKDSGNTSSHGRMHAAMCALALGRTSDLQRSLEEFIKNRAFYNSLISAHYNHQNVFNIDANGALPRIYQDAVLYPTEKEKVSLFQAVPDSLETGELRGVFLPGNIKVNTFSWNIKKRTFDLELIASRDTELEITLSPCFYVQKERTTLKLKKGKLKRIHFEGGYLNEEVVGKSPT